jgi:hypothetical protein
MNNRGGDGTPWALLLSTRRAYLATTGMNCHEVNEPPPYITTAHIEEGF